MKKRWKRILASVLVLAMCAVGGCGKKENSTEKKESASQQEASSGNAEEGTAEAGTTAQRDVPEGTVTRTIMFYPIGSNLESNHAMLSKNLEVALESGIPESVHFIVATLGSDRWFMDADYLYDSDGNHVEIDSDKKQLWRLSGKTSEGTARMTLVGELSFEKSALRGECLTEFIDYCRANYPSDRYDLIMWDHGYGPMGFGEDFAMTQEMDVPKMRVADMADAIENSTMEEPFEFIHFDACLMSNVETILALADYAENFVVSAALEPGDGGNYEWIASIDGHEDMSGFEIGKCISDAYVDYYDAKGGTDFKEATMAVLHTESFLPALIPAMTELMQLLADEPTKNAADGKVSFYDELLVSGLSILYSSDYSLYDLMLLAEPLGIRLTEKATEGEADEQRRNNYSEAVKALKSVLSDESMFYQRSSTHIQKAADYAMHRDADGSVVKDEKLVPGGINIFFPGGKDTAARDYLHDMEAMIGHISESGVYDTEGRIKLLGLFMEAAAEYEMIRSTGRTIAELSESGGSDIGLDDVMNRWKAEDPAIIAAYERQGYSAEDMPEKTQWDQSIRVIYEKLKTVLEAKGISADEWLDRIIRQQCGETVLAANAAVSEGDGQTDITLSGTMPQAVDYLKPLIEKVVVKPEGSDSYATIGKLSGRLAGEDPYVGDDVTLSVDKVTDTWYEFIDGEGNGHMMALNPDESNPNLFYIPVMIKSAPDESGYEQELNGVLYVEREKDAYSITGFRVSYESDPTELTEETYPDAEISLCAIPEKNDYRSIVNNSFFALKDTEKWKIEADVPLSEIDDLTDEVRESLSRTYAVKDIYGVEHPLP